MKQLLQWKSFYSSEQELIEAVRDINVKRFNELCDKEICSGNPYITRTSVALKGGEKLSDPQLRMIKRLAKQVYKYYNHI